MGARRAAAGYGANDPEYRARKAARRRRRRRQRRILAGIMAVLLVMVGCAAVAGVRYFGKQRALRTLRSEGITAVEGGDYRTAVAKFDEALALLGEKNGTFKTDVLQYRAEACYNMGDYAASLLNWQQLMAQDQENIAYKENAVLCMLLTDDLEGAMAVGALQNRVYNQKALKEIQEGAYDQALESIERGLAADDGSMAADLAFNQAVAYEGKRDFKKALELFQAYAASFGADENVQREITFLESRQGSYEQALPDVSGSAEVQTPPDDASGTQPSSEVTGGQPTSGATGAQPSSEVTGGQPTSGATGTQPSSEVTGGQSTSGATGAQPSSEVTGGQPTSGATGTQPSSEVTGGQSTSGATGAQPSSGVTGGQSISGVTGTQPTPEAA